MTVVAYDRTHLVVCPSTSTKQTLMREHLYQTPVESILKRYEGTILYRNEMGEVVRKLYRVVQDRYDVEQIFGLRYDSVLFYPDASYFDENIVELVRSRLYS